MHPCKAQSERCRWPRTPTSKRCPLVSRRQREEKKETRDNSFYKRFFRAISTHDSSRYRDRCAQILAQDLTYRRDRRWDTPLGYLDESSSAYKSISARDLYLPASSFRLSDKHVTYTRKCKSLREIVPMRSVPSRAAATFSSVCLLFLDDSGVRSPSCLLRVKLDCKAS